MGYTEQGIIFPVSASILTQIQDYAKTLESYSHPILNFIDWKPSENNNVEILNDTIDYYRYFDATAQAEFLFNCVNDTLINIIPKEVEYIKKYDVFKQFLDNRYEMPDNIISLMVGFLEQGKGRLSKRAISSEFNALTVDEIRSIEEQYQLVFFEK
jgi:hypothetical protein